jgi:hypothetical protein
MTGRPGGRGRADRTPESLARTRDRKGRASARRAALRAAAEGRTSCPPRSRLRKRRRHHRRMGAALRAVSANTARRPASAAPRTAPQGSKPSARRVEVPFRPSLAAAEIPGRQARPRRPFQRRRADRRARPRCRHGSGLRGHPPDARRDRQRRARGRVHVVGLSILSGSHVPLVREVMERMRSEGLDARAGGRRRHHPARRREDAAQPAASPPSTRRRIRVEPESAPSYFCGTGGCPLYLFVSQGNEYIRVWNDLVHAWKPAKVRGLPGIQFDLHGTACGLAGADACTKTYMFDGNRLREVK